MRTTTSGGRAALVAVLLSCSGLLPGCASVVADLPVVGLPADAPKRPAEPRAFLPIHDLPDPDRAGRITSAEQQKIQADLVAARARSAAAAAAK